MISPLNSLLKEKEAYFEAEVVLKVQKSINFLETAKNIQAKLIKIYFVNKNFRKNRKVLEKIVPLLS